MVYDGNTDVVYKSSLICEGTVFTGNIESKLDIVVEGIVNGNVVCHDLVVRETGNITGDIVANSISLYSPLTGNLKIEKNVTIFENAEITGDITTESLICEGKVNGNIECSELLQLKNNAVVKGDCASSRVMIDPSVVINGNLTTKPKEKKVVQQEAPVLETTEEENK